MTETTPVHADDLLAQQSHHDGRKPVDLSDDTPLEPVCDLSGDGTCEACQ